MMTSETLSQLTTYDDYRHLPDNGKQYQIIGGELYMTPAPSPYHQEISINLSSILQPHVLKYKLGKILCAPVDVVLSMTDVVQPDIIFITDKRLNIITKKNIVEAPDLVVEILSDHTRAIDREKKKQLYERHGVKEYWIVDPESKKIELYILKHKSFSLSETATRGKSLTSPLLKNLKISFDKIF